MITFSLSIEMKEEDLEVYSLMMSIMQVEKIASHLSRIVLNLSLNLIFQSLRKERTWNSLQNTKNGNKLGEVDMLSSTLYMIEVPHLD